MKQYLDLLRHIMTTGVEKNDRTGVGIKSIFGYQMHFDLNDGFPCITTKKIHVHSIIVELLWFLRGDTNIQYLNDNGVSIWNEWADAQGNLGPIYGKQWRSWGGAIDKKKQGIDQIKTILHQIKNTPDSRRMVVNSWNVGVLDKMAIPPCHCLFQFYVAEGVLSCQLYQRSADVFLGVPFNIASYALLTLMIAQVCDLRPGRFIHTLGDAHIYRSHFVQVHRQLSRDPLPLATMNINPRVKDLFSFTVQDFTLEDYRAHPHIAAQVAI